MYKRQALANVELMRDDDDPSQIANSLYQLIAKINSGNFAAYGGS